MEDDVVDEILGADVLSAMADGFHRAVGRRTPVQHHYKGESPYIDWLLEEIDRRRLDGTLVEPSRLDDDDVFFPDD